MSASEVAVQKLNKERLECTLHNLDMTTMELEKKYDNVFIGCGSFMVLDYDEGIRCLQHIRKMLNPKGEILLDLFIPWDDIRIGKTEQFGISRDVAKANERCIVYEQFEHKIHEQRKYGIYKYEHYKDGQLVMTEVNTLNIRWYYEREIEHILMGLGYSNIKILENESSYSRNESFMVTATR